MINRTLHGHLGKWNFSSVEKYYVRAAMYYSLFNS